MSNEFYIQQRTRKNTTPFGCKLSFSGRRVSCRCVGRVSALGVGSRFFLFVGIKKRRKEFRWRVIARFVLSLPVFVNFGSSFKPSDSSPSPCCLLRFAQTGAPHLLHVCKKLCGTTSVFLEKMCDHGMTRFLAVLSHRALMSPQVAKHVAVCHYKECARGS